MTADLAELLARVEGAEAGDQQAMLRQARSTLVPIADDNLRFIFRFNAQLDAGGYESAALALAVRVLPECRVMVERDHSGEGWAMVHPAAPGDAERSMIDGKTPALAVVAALLMALIVQAEAPQSSEAQPLGCAGEAELSTLPGMNQEDGPE